MKFIADLHIHSRFSRATAKNLNFENLYISARTKGITVVGTGDFTHPGWFAEIMEHLIPAEPGLFKLKDDLEAECKSRLPFRDDSSVRFMLSCEISNIYKKSDKTRKIHNLVFLPDLESAARFNARLEKIGNIHSDGRPILGLDSKNLLEIVLETSQQGFLIPAHIWTPWFSLFGSKSGFDAIEECFEDLTPHIFAIETGLSSDPAMNWRVENLDGLTIISNSDAHSPANLGREANLFDVELSYAAIKKALEAGHPEQFLGTLEFFPQEGKYHHDGHRKCNVNLHPAQSIQHHDKCPVCGQTMTLGVLHRVEELATRPEGDKPAKTHPYYSIIPMAEIISEIVGTGPKSKKVDQMYQSAIERLGPELDILHCLPIEQIEKSGIPLLGEAVRRMRERSIHIEAGYDGEYGRITVFEPGEKDRLMGQKSLFHDNSSPKNHITKQPQQAMLNLGVSQKTAALKPPPTQKKQTAVTPAADDIFSGLNDEQKKAVTHGDGPVIIVAGPGTGKTKTLTCRIAYLIKHCQVNPGSILAVTFTNKAAKEMSNRLRIMLGEESALPLAATFHAFCLKILKDRDPAAAYVIIDDVDRKALVRDAIGLSGFNSKDIKIRPDAVCECIISAKQQLLHPSDNLESVSGDMEPGHLATVYGCYQELLDARHCLDYEDLILKTVACLEGDPTALQALRERYRYLFVDEYQDLNYGQYRIICALAPPDGNIFVIGDPDQSIYGFRGSDVSYFQRFVADFPNAAQYRLTQNYRSEETILEASHQVIRNHSLNSSGSRVYSGMAGLDAIHILETETEKSEAVAVGKAIEQMVGGTGFYFDDFGKNKSPINDAFRSFSDFAVLYRTHAQADVFAEAFSKAGIPFQTANKETTFGRESILLLMTLLRLVEGSAAPTNLERIAPKFAKKISEQELTDRIQPLARETAGWRVDKKLVHLAELFGIYDKSMYNAAEKATMDQVLVLARPFNDNAAGFLEMAALLSDHDIYDAASQKVALMTFHAAKGLEFPVVFIAGCENGYVPFIRKDSCDPDEERRLFYVAMTRAKEMLFLCYAKKRLVFGRTEKRELSPFVADIENRLLKKQAPEPHKKTGPIQLKLFSF